jgi:hypothetical protein
VRRIQTIISAAMVLLLCSSLLVAAPGFAEKDTPAYPEMKTASGFSRAFQNITGLTPITGWFANHVLHRELGRYVQGDLHSKLGLFSGTDLLGGKAKTIAITGHHVLLDGYIPLSEFHFENQGDMPLYISKGHRPLLLRPVQFNVSAVMSEQDMNRLLTSEKGRKLLTGMKVTIPPFGPQYLDFMQPTVTLEDGLFTLQSRINKNGAPLENALPVKVSGKITPDHAALTLSNLDLQIEGIQDTAEIEQLIENYFSELVNLNHIKVDRHRVKVTVTQSDVTEHQLTLAAIVTVKPDDKALKRLLSQR